MKENEVSLFEDSRSVFLRVREMLRAQHPEKRERELNETKSQEVGN